MFNNEKYCDIYSDDEIYAKKELIHDDILLTSRLRLIEQYFQTGYPNSFEINEILEPKKNSNQLYMLNPKEISELLEGIISKEQRIKIFKGIKSEEIKFKVLEEIKSEEIKSTLLKEVEHILNDKKNFNQWLYTPKPKVKYYHLKSSFKRQNYFPKKK